MASLLNPACRSDELRDEKFSLKHLTNVLILIRSQKKLKGKEKKKKTNLYNSELPNVPYSSLTHKQPPVLTKDAPFLSLSLALGKEQIA